MPFITYLAPLYNNRLFFCIQEHLDTIPCLNAKSTKEIRIKLNMVGFIHLCCTVRGHSHREICFTSVAISCHFYNNKVLRFVAILPQKWYCVK